MLRSTFLSLALGLGAALVALTLLLSPPRTAGPDAQPVHWDTSSADVVAGDGQIRNDTLVLQLNAAGVGGVRLPLRGRDASHYPFLHIALDQFPTELGTNLVWRQADSDEQHRYALKTRPRQSHWLAVHELSRWSGPLESLTVLFFGPPATEIHIGGISLHPPGVTNQLHTLIDDWTGVEPWRRAAVNSYSGARPISPFYPAPLFAAVLALSLTALALLYVLRRKPRPFSWRSAGLIFLICWFLLDGLWQYRLLRQVADTYRQFAGKDTAEKLAVGPDARFYHLAQRARHHFDNEKSRVFVSSSDDYHGLRTAYYLYPHNPYYQVRGHELPHPKYLRAGDYILIVQPAQTPFRRQLGIVQTQWGRIPVDPLFSEDGDTLLRVK